MIWFYFFPGLHCALNDFAATCDVAGMKIISTTKSEIGYFIFRETQIGFYASEWSITKTGGEVGVVFINSERQETKNWTTEWSKLVQ